MTNVLAGDSRSKQERNSAFEILRIIAIIFIIAHHFSVHGGFDFSELSDSTLILVNKTYIDFIAQLGKVGVNLFVLISAFFLIDNNKFRTRKILYIIVEMLSFSIVIGVLFFFIEQKEFSFSLLKHIIFPFGSGTWWFMTSYLLLYILSPFLNLGIKAMKKELHLFFIILLIVIWSLLPTFLYLDYGYTTFCWFLLLYLIGSYIKIYDVSIKTKPFLGIFISVFIFFVWFTAKHCFSYLLDDSNLVASKIIGWFNLADMNNFIQVSTTVVIFLSFKAMKTKNYKFINIIASTTLTIYLFHDHDDMRNLLWVDLFKNSTYATSPFLIPYSIGVILCVFIIGVLIGLIYKYSVGSITNKFLDIMDKRCLYKVDDICNQVVIKK